MPLIPISATNLFAEVDAEDFALISAHKWFQRPHHGNLYAIANIVQPDGKRKTVQMHSLILPEAGCIDHRDGNGLNNRRENLRPARSRDNTRNNKGWSTRSSPYKGVRYKDSRWEARITFNYAHIYLGVFKTPEEAARAYDAAALLLFGDFARVNLP
jgi:hypothetical protein